MRKGRTSSKAMSRYKAYKARKHRTKARVVFNHVEVTKSTEINLVSKENKNTRVAFNSMDIDKAENVTLVPKKGQEMDMSRPR